VKWLEGLEERLAADGLEHWLPDVVDACREAVAPGRHGDLLRWEQALAQLPDRITDELDATGPSVRIGRAGELDADEQARLREALAELRPWRKGPFSLFGLEVDAEWRSDLKWDRLAKAGLPWSGARVLDVGCGNGYYAWRALGAGARRVIGVDPTLVHMMQFAACRQLVPETAIDLLPIPAEALPEGRGEFDLVLSMGVLYHRRSPIDHLAELIRRIAPGGSLVIETLVVPGDAGTLLCPPGRYARMRNVWFLPSTALLIRWLERLGLDDIRCVDETPTTIAEQRPTEWMPFESLASALDPEQPARTVEGHPGPVRALVTARRKTTRKKSADTPAVRNAARETRDHGR
jgi:tRNA (mo5U34)-methyltransferase